MNALTPVRNPTKLEKFVGEVLPLDQRDQFYSVLPRHISPDRFERALSNVLMNNPELMAADPRLIFREISKVVGLGLLLDPQLGEAYLILAWNGKTKQKEPQARVGYKGLIKLAKQSGEILNIYAREVHEKDEIECVQGDEQRLIHKPLLFTDRGPVVGYYAVVKYRNGEIDFEPMSVQQVHDIRDRSDGWKAFKAGKIQSTPWSTDEGEMAKKTVFRRLTKRVSQSPDLNDAIAIEDRAEFPAFGGRAELQPPAAPRQIASEPPAAPRMIEHRAEPQATTEQPVAPAHDADGVVSMDELLAELADRLGFATTREAVEEAYTDFDAEALLSDYEGGVEVARKLKAEHLGRVPGALPPASAQGLTDDFPGNDAIEVAGPPAAPKMLGEALNVDPFAIPETFKGGGHYQIFIRSAVAAAKAPEHEDRLRAIWKDTGPQRADLTAQGQLEEIDTKILKDEIITAIERVRAAAPAAVADDLPPAAPRQQAQEFRESTRADDDVPAAAKPASDDPVASYTAKQERALAACTTRNQVEAWFTEHVAERDGLGLNDIQRANLRSAKQRRAAELPASTA